MASSSTGAGSRGRVFPSFAAAASEPLTREASPGRVSAYSIGSLAASDQATFIDQVEESSADGLGSPAVAVGTRRSSREVSHKSHHHHGPLYPEKALAVGGLSFAPVYTEMENAERTVESERKWPSRIMSVTLQLLTGVLTGVAAFIVSRFSDYLSSARLGLALKLLRGGAVLEAWLTAAGVMVALVLAGAMPVILWVRSAGSSGIPSIIGVLNGCDLRDHFTWRILLARLVGVTCAVSSGLAVGPEGPMIYIGACTGALLSRIPSQRGLWRYLGRLPSSKNEHVYLRDYVSTGAACGIAAAFRAPIAGALFIVEEAASHFRPEQLAKMFASGVAAMVVAGLLCQGTGMTGMFAYDVGSGFVCRTWDWMRIVDFLFFAVLGVVCGLAGALFNALNVGAAKFRARHIGPSAPLRRTVELVLLCVASSTCWVLAPLIWEDRTTADPHIFARATRCIEDTWVPEVSSGAKIEGKHVRLWPKPCFYGVQYNPKPSGCPKAWEEAQAGNVHAKACTEGLAHHNVLETLENKSFYCCSFSSIDELKAGHFRLPGVNVSCSIDLGETFPCMGKCRSADAPVQEEMPNFYNPMASLTLVSFDDTAKNLMVRGAPHLFPLGTLLCFLCLYFVLAGVTAGSAIPSGLLLPMIIIGALIGRILSLVLLEVQYRLNLYSHGSQDVSMWSREWQPFFHYMGGPLPDTVPFATEGWLDPGVGALVGAAAFLGGCSRISLMTTVMMVEITGDPVMIAPVGVATLVAVVVGNCWNHGLYHSLIDVASFPFLPSRWPKGIQRSLRVEHLLQTQGAPVASVPLTAQRTELRAALDGHAFSGFPVVGPDGAVVGLATRGNLEKMLSELTDTVDVGRTTDFHHVTIQASLPLEVAFNLFKQMELAHITVVDSNYLPKAVLTRGSLLPWVVQDRISRRTVRPTIQRPRGFRTASEDMTLAAVGFGLDAAGGGLEGGHFDGEVVTLQVGRDCEVATISSGGISRQASGPEMSPLGE